MNYLVAPRTFWDNLPYVRQLTCGRVRFTDGQAPHPPDVKSFPLKAEAVQAMAHDASLVLVREVFLDGTSWHYQLLNNSKSPTA